MNAESFFLVNGVYCPRCKAASFNQARLVEPLELIHQERKSILNKALLQEDSTQNAQPYFSGLENASITQELSPASSGRSSFMPSRLFQNGSTAHSTKGSGENTSFSSSRGRRSLFKSGPSTPKAHIYHAMFVDGKFLLAFTSKKIYCHDCELKSWSEGHSFGRIIMAAGSFIRYAVISEENRASATSQNLMDPFSDDFIDL